MQVDRFFFASITLKKKKELINISGYPVFIQCNESILKNSKKKLESKKEQYENAGFIFAWKSCLPVNSQINNMNTVQTYPYSPKKTKYNLN